MWLHGALCFATALLFYDDTPILIGFTLIYGIFFYMGCYHNAVRLTGGYDGATSDSFCDVLTAILASAVPSRRWR